MRALVLALAVCIVSAPLALHAKGKGGSHSVRGHVKKDGTYVAPHRATNADGRKSNNWSQKGNVNPYTGKEGTKSN